MYVPLGPRGGGVDSLYINHFKDVIRIADSNDGEKRMASEVVAPNIELEPSLVWFWFNTASGLDSLILVRVQDRSQI